MGPDGNTTIKGDDDIELLVWIYIFTFQFPQCSKKMLPVVMFIGTIIMVSMSKLS